MNNPLYISNDSSAPKKRKCSELQRKNANTNAKAVINRLIDLSDEEEDTWGQIKKAKIDVGILNMSNISLLTNLICFY